MTRHLALLLPPLVLVLLVAIALHPLAGLGSVLGAGR